MDEYMAATRGIEIRGIPARDWADFFKHHKDGA